MLVLLLEILINFFSSLRDALILRTVPAPTQQPLRFEFRDLWMNIHRSKQDPIGNDGNDHPLIPSLSPYRRSSNCAVYFYGDCTNFRYALRCNCEKLPMICNPCRMINGKSFAGCRWCGYLGTKITNRENLRIYWFLYAMWNSYCISNQQKMINWRDFLNEIRPIMSFIESQVAKVNSFCNFIGTNRSQIYMLFHYMICMRGVPHSLNDLHTTVVRQTKSFLSKECLYLKVLSHSSCTDYVTGTFMKFMVNRLILLILQYYPGSGKKLRQLWEIMFLRIILTKRARVTLKFVGKC